MPYVGRDLQRGNYLKLDDISSSFNGSTTTFNLTSGGNAFFPGSAFSIIVSLGGVVQEPESAFQIDKSQIIFAQAPTTNDDFFCIVQGVALGVGVPGHNTVGNNQLAKPLSYSDYFRWDSANNRVGINTLLPSVDLDVVGDAAFSGNVSIGGTLTYEDVANIDAVGIITARAGIEDKTLTQGRVVFVGSNERLSDSATLTYDGTSLVSPQIIVGSALTANSTGLSVAGITTFSNNVHILDNDYLRIGGSVGTYDGLDIYHASNHSYIKDSGTGRLIIQSSQLCLQDTSGYNHLIANPGGSVQIYHDFDNNSTPKIETTSVGANIDYKLIVGGGAGYPGIVQLKEGGALSEIRATRNSDSNSDLQFKTERGDGTQTRARINYSGDFVVPNNKVGIGTDNPAYTLEALGDGGGSFSASTNSTHGQLSVVGKNSSGQVSAISRIKSYPDGSSSQAHMAFETRNSSSQMVEALRIDSSGRVLIGNSSTNTQEIGDGTLQVFTSDRKHPAIKVNAGNANGFTLLSDVYKADESQVNFGISFSSSKLVLSTSVKVSDTDENVYLSSQDTFAAKPCALTMDHQGVLTFLNTNTNATTTTDSAVTLTERLIIKSNGRIEIGTGTGVFGSAPIEVKKTSSSGWGDYPEHISLVDQKGYNEADNGGGITFSGKYNSGGSATTFGSIHGKKATTADGNFGGILTFNTREHGNSNFERMRIDSLGRVFINSVGPTTPTQDYRSINLVAHAHTEAGISFSRSHTVMGSGSTGGKSIVLHSDASLYISTHNVGRDLTITSSGDVLFSGLTSKNDPRNNKGISLKSASGISFQNFGANGSHNWRIRPDDMVGWGTLEFAVSPTANSSTDWPDAATDVALCLKPDKNVVIPNGRLGVGLNGTPSADFEVVESTGADYGHTKQGWARKRTFSAVIQNNETRYYKIVNYQQGNMLVGRLEVYTSRGGGFNQTKGYNEWRVSYGGYTSGGTGTIYGTSAENTSFQAGTATSVDLVIGSGTNQDLWIKIPGSVYSGRAYFIFEGIYANWQWDEGTYQTTAP